MERILFLYRERNARVESLVNILCTKYFVFESRSFDEVKNILDTVSLNEIVALIIDNPSTCERFNEIIEYVENKNTFMFNLPVLLSSDFEHVRDDDIYLSRTAVGIILKGESENMIIRKIENTVKFINSTSFEEFSDMLKVLPSLIYLKDTKGRYAFCSQH